MIAVRRLNRRVRAPSAEARTGMGAVHVQSWRGKGLQGERLWEAAGSALRKHREESLGVRNSAAQSLETPLLFIYHS